MIGFLHWKRYIVRIWETVGRELRILHDEGGPIPVSNWSTWSLSKSVLEPTQTTEDLETKEEGEFTPLLRNISRVPEQNYQREYLAPNFDADIPPLPPIRNEVPRTRKAATSRIVKKKSTITEHHLSSTQDGLLWV